MVRYLLTAAAAISLAVPAQAGVVSLAGVVKPGQGLVSGRTPIIEDNFNTDAAPGTCAREVSNGPSARPRIRFRGLTGPEGDFEFTTGSVPNFQLAPAGNSSCYVSVSRSSQGGFMEVDFVPSSGAVRYVGFEWGSVDQYNRIQAFDPSGNQLTLTGGTGPGAFSLLTLTGTQLANAFGVPLYGTYYTEIRFTAAEGFAFLKFQSDNYAFEADNFAFSTTAIASRGINAGKSGTSGLRSLTVGFDDGFVRYVPGVAGTPFQNAVAFDVAEPGTLALALGGLGLLGFARRRRG